MRPPPVSAHLVMAIHRRTGIGVMDAKKYLEMAPELLRERLMAASRQEPWPGYFLDPIEFDPQFEEVFRQANKQTDEELQGNIWRMGACHLYESTKQRILREQYGIEWYTPAEMNPGIYFD